MTSLQTLRDTVVTAEASAVVNLTRRRRGSHLRDNRTAYLMLAPMVVLLAIFVFWPLVYSIYLSAFEVSFYEEPVFVGMQFYQYVLESPGFWNAIGVGLRFALIVVPLQMIFGFVIASVIKGLGRRLAGFMKTTVYVPTVVSAVIASIVFVFMYRADGGLINWLLSLVGTGPFAFISDPLLALPAIAVPAIWLVTGITALIMLAGMLDIPESYYEAAELEGARFLQKTFYITIPLMKNVLLFLLVTGFVGALQQFELPLVMTQGGPVNATMTPNLFIFNQFKDPTPYATSFSITAALLLFVVLGTISALIFRLVKSDKAIDG
ncbi:carbohydrate ABC transporter permease [Agromyces albus]|uniref:carbohydrate ABC transporter permease n=1 Tax=Agromyces albus TaxID=205332 RepID=UPI00278B53D0|nr:sugar ABC transporter permease [Agromyces albus]MDQ0574905.1 multiple sugar transport system permease protein [Agromyces albus]